jgi:hypothetical protein
LVLRMLEHQLNDRLPAFFVSFLKFQSIQDELPFQQDYLPQVHGSLDNAISPSNPLMSILWLFFVALYRDHGTL